VTTCSTGNGQDFSLTSREVEGNFAISYQEKRVRLIIKRLQATVITVLSRATAISQAYAQQPILPRQCMADHYFGAWCNAGRNLLPGRAK
jgi:hypothetical protein